MFLSQDTTRYMDWSRQFCILQFGNLWHFFSYKFTELMYLRSTHLAVERHTYSLRTHTARLTSPVNSLQFGQPRSPGLDPWPSLGGHRRDTWDTDRNLSNASALHEPLGRQRHLARRDHCGRCMANPTTGLHGGSWFEGTKEHMEQIGNIWNPTSH